MAFELLTKTLTEAGIAPEVVTQLVSNEKAARQIQEWHESGLRQSDYDRKMNAGKAENEARAAELREQQAAFEQTKKNINDQYLAGVQSREQAEAALANARVKARSQAAVYGIDFEKEIFGEGTFPPNPAPVRREEPVNTSSDVDKRLAALEDLFKTNVNFEVEMHDIVRQHMELFPDKPLVMKDLLDDAVKQRRTPSQVWDDKFGATQRRTEIMADKYRAEGAAKAKEELEKKYSGQQVNGFRTDIPMSPVMQLATAKERQLSAPKDRSARAAESIQNAVEAFNSGKYRNLGKQERTA